MTLEFGFHALLRYALPVPVMLQWMKTNPLLSEGLDLPCAVIAVMPSAIDSILQFCGVLNSFKVALRLHWRL